MRVMFSAARAVLGVRVAHDGQHVDQTERSRHGDPLKPATSCNVYAMSHVRSDGCFGR